MSAYDDLMRLTRRLGASEPGATTARELADKLAYLAAANPAAYRTLCAIAWVFVIQNYEHSEFPSKSH